jgi:hypothetical protein
MLVFFTQWHTHRNVSAKKPEHQRHQSGNKQTKNHILTILDYKLIFLGIVGAG